MDGDGRMTDYKQARYKDGRAYAGETRYLGNGKLRSCGRCGKHCEPLGFRLVRPWGMICSTCNGGKK
jgi:hypothetical protein